MYLSAYSALAKYPPTTYYPELQDEIWDGVISIDQYLPTELEWETFTQAVIERSHDAIWTPYISQPSNTSSIEYAAGKLYCEPSFCVLFIVFKFIE